MRIGKTEIIICALIIIGIMGVGGYFLFGDQPAPPLQNVGKEVILEIANGMTPRDIDEILFAEGLIAKKGMFLSVAKKNKQDRALKAGRYKFEIGMTPAKIVSIIVNSETVKKTLLIPEGFNIVQIAERIEQEKIGNKEKFLKLATNFTPYDYMKTDNPVVKYKAEGFLFPATYFIEDGMTEEELLSMMVNVFDHNVREAMKEANSSMDIRLLATMASLVEKEAQVEEDRPIIAGVFLNRLNIDMPLQSCATIQYILGYPKPELTIADTQIESRYNTYQNMGLPPGPIANSGMAVINAVLTAPKTNYLFFVVGKNGKHLFAETYSEHNTNIDLVSQ